MTQELPDTIVVVDDYPDGRLLTSTILRNHGLAVREAASGAEALALAIILDVNLPDIDGFEVCRRLKSDPRTAAVSVLHLSAAHRRVDDRVRGLDVGADAYLTLPVEAEALVATVRALLRARRAERRLQATEARFRRLVDAALEGVWMVDAEGRTTYANPSLATLLGYGIADMLGRRMEEFLHDGGLRAVSHVEGAQRDVRLRRRDGSELWALLSTIGIQDDDGRFAGMLGLVIDITQRRRAEAAERESAGLRAVTRLANSAGHEINNPLLLITGQLHFLRKNPEMPRERLDALEDAAFRVRDIVMQMLRVTRLELDVRDPELPEMLDLPRSAADPLAG